LNLQSSSSLRLKFYFRAFARKTNGSRKGANKEKPKPQRVAARFVLDEENKTRERRELLLPSPEFLLLTGSL
jgi:hypothetical protein